MDLEQRIAQFENMAEADPENEMAHFSLGGAYMQAERFDDAAKSYRRCIELVPDMSKAYQLAGEALIKSGDADAAAQVWTEGYRIAAERGDLMPKRAMAGQLESMGRDLPEVAGEDTSAEQLMASGAFVCQRTGRPGTKMDRPPFKGKLGEWIQENISQETFNEWIAQGTKVINELRLDLSRDEDAETYDRYMREYLGVDEDLYAKITSSG